MARSRELITALQKVHGEIDGRTRLFAEAAGLSCPSGCGKCCDYFDIEVPVLDCLPIADHLIRSGNAEKMLAGLNTPGALNHCPVYVSAGGSRGFCSAYQNRPALCRLFGYAALRNRTGDLRLVACDILKDRLIDLYRQAEPPAAVMELAAVVDDYSTRLSTIDPVLGTESMPIALALKKALEILLLERSYDPDSPQPEASPANPKTRAA